MFDHAFVFAFGLTILAGLSTGIGSLLAFFARHTNHRFLALSMGFSAGVMLFVSMLEILPEGQRILEHAMGGKTGAWVALASFFGGIAFIALIDKLIPEHENPHESHEVEEMRAPKRHEHGMGRAHARMLRTGLLVALAISIHNFPEGLATFMVALREPLMGIPIAVAIALHNIPEGIAVSIPVYYATGSRRRAFLYSFLSGLAEPAGALVGYFLLLPILNDVVFGALFAMVAGIMVFIALDQLLPTAEKYGEHHLCIYGLVAGMAVMGISLRLLA